MTLTLLALTAVPLTVTGGEVYKWVDQNGKVTYGDHPQGTRAEKVEVGRAPEVSRELREQHLRTQRALEAYATERAERQDARVARAAEVAERKRNCTRARDEQRRREQAAHLYYLDEQGNKRIIDGAEYEAAQEEARSAVRNFCE